MCESPVIQGSCVLSVHNMWPMQAALKDTVADRQILPACSCTPRSLWQDFVESKWLPTWDRSLLGAMEFRHGMFDEVFRLQHIRF